MNEEKTLGFCCVNCRLPVLKHHWRIEYATTVIDVKTAPPVENYEDFDIARAWETLFIQCLLSPIREDRLPSIYLFCNNLR